MPQISPKLIRIIEPDDKFKFDLLLYTSVAGQPKPQEHWTDVWYPDGEVYRQFLEAWDKKTCPSCLTETITSSIEKKYLGDDSEGINALSSTIYYEVRRIYTCKTCKLGWCEYMKRETIVEVSYP